MKGRESRYTYVIFALICLIIFNLGTILINAMGDSIKVTSVFNEEKTIIYNDVFFLNLFSRTSSAINLYKKQMYPNSSWELYPYNKDYFISGFLDFVKSQFPSILWEGKKNKTIETHGFDYEDLEKSIIVEDFIIIDKVEEYEDLIIISDTEGNLILENLPKPINIKPLKIDKEKPYILIYHTHGTEAYSNLETNIHHTTDRAYNVVTIGENVAKVLENKGHKVGHMTTYHDIPSYNKSYSRSLNTVTDSLGQNSNFKILIDLHRDGIDLGDPKVKKSLDKHINRFKTKINGKDVATFYFVIGPDSPNKESVLNFAKYFKAVCDIIYPELCTGILIKPVGKYNQFLSDYSMLVELGSNLNTMEEAMETSKLFAELLDIVVQNILE